MKTLSEIYDYREMILSLVRRDLRGRYKGSVLGFAWTFLSPLFQLLVYTLVFSVIMRAGVEDYYIFLFVALVPWIFFSSSITGGAGSIRAQSEMVKKIYFPREVIPISYVVSQFVNMLLSFIVVFAFLAISGRGFNLIALCFLPVIMVIEFILTLPIVFFVSAVTVYLRDVEYFLGIVLMAWQFMTPVLYGMDQIPEEIVPFFWLNPMTAIIIAYRDVLYYKKIPEVSTLLQAILWSFVMLCVGWITFDRLKRHFAEEM